MKKVILCSLACFLFACGATTDDKQTDTNKKGNSYCDDSKNSVCEIGKSADMSAYKNITENDNQFVSGAMDKAIQIFKEKQDGIIYFGYPKCPWCEDAIPILNTVAKESKKKILYVETRDSNKKLLYTDAQKAEIITYAKDFMNKDDEGKLQIFVPFVVVVKDGKVTSAHIGTVDGHDAKERDMNKKEEAQLKQIYKDMLK